MKIYIPTKLELIRLTIKDEKSTEYLNLVETTHEEAIKLCLNTFSNKMFKCEQGKTTIDLRHCIGGENLKSQRVTLFDTSVKEVLNKLNKILC